MFRCQHGKRIDRGIGFCVVVSRRMAVKLFINIVGVVYIFAINYEEPGCIKIIQFPFRFEMSKYL